MSETTHDPALMRGVIPCLGLDGRAAEAIAFWQRAFGARALARLPMDDVQRLMHAEIEINGGCMMPSDGQDPTRSEQRPLSESGIHLQLVVSDGTSWWEHAVAAGCTVTMPFERQFWGDRFGMLRDPFGVTWAINEDAGQAAGTTRPAA